MRFDKRTGTYLTTASDTPKTIKTCPTLPESPTLFGSTELQQQTKLNSIIVELARLEEILRALERRSILIVLQGVDGAGKDSLIKHFLEKFRTRIVDYNVNEFIGLKPDAHLQNFLKRFEKGLPRPGEITVFNRSYYEEVLTARIHPELLGFSAPTSEAFWLRRIQKINDFENKWASHGILFIKIFLNISQNEQNLRLLRRLENPEKTWKFSPTDFTERIYWDEYISAYCEILRLTNPWHIIPADKKWFSRIAAGEIILSDMHKLKLQFPLPERKDMRTIEELKAVLQKNIEPKP